MTAHFHVINIASAHVVGGRRRMESNAALVRPARVVVLNPNSSEHFRRAVVHPYREGDVVFPHWHSQQLAARRVKTKTTRDAIEMRLCFPQRRERRSFGVHSIQRVQCVHVQPQFLTKTVVRIRSSRSR
jgi:hypothetical protein